MEKINSLLRELTEARRQQTTLKQQLRSMGGGDDAYQGTLMAFRQADNQVQALVDELARQFKGNEEAFLDLSEGDRTLLSELGLAIAPVSEQTSDDLVTLVGKYRQTGAVYTAAQKLNEWRMDCSGNPAELDAKLETKPDNIDESAWIAAVTKFRKELDKLPQQDELVDRQREAAYTVQAFALGAFDALHKKLVTAVADLVDHDRLDTVLAEFEPLLRKWLRDFVRQVPQREPPEEATR
jgi:GGDEF domain-containing protein